MIFFFFAIITINIDFFFYCENSTLLRDQTEARRAEKFFWDRPPLSQGLDDPPPPLILKSGSAIVVYSATLHVLR